MATHKPKKKNTAKPKANPKSSPDHHTLPKQEIRQPQVQVCQYKPPAPVKTPFWKNVYKFSGKTIANILILSGLIVVTEQYHTCATPREKLWEEKTYINGVSIPLDRIDITKGLSIVFGGSSNLKHIGLGNTYFFNQLEDTLAYNPKSALVIMPGGDAPFNLRFLLKDKRLYIATTFKDIDGKYIGKMDFTKWELKSSKISNYHDGDDNMEIIDDNNHVLFSMKFLFPNIIIVHGYFVGDEGVQVADDFTFSGWSIYKKEYKDSALARIRKITPLNNY